MCRKAVQKKDGSSEVWNYTRVVQVPPRERSKSNTIQGLMAENSPKQKTSSYKFREEIQTGFQGAQLGASHPDWGVKGMKK